ncbi:hypothetical protein ACMYSO_02700 [Klebsiella sp. B345]|uniref:hypothetical protein n=1 Tax=Klebsiella sp. B345 TaxID=2755398 RepID=UPI003DA7D7DA
MNLRALHFIVENAEECLVESANQTHREPNVVLGIARKVVAEQTVENLSEAQLFNFNTAILPLIHDVPCQGFMSPLDDEPVDCPNTIDDDNLLECYETETFLCPSCTAEGDDFHAHRENWFRRNP